MFEALKEAVGVAEGNGNDSVQAAELEVARAQDAMVLPITAKRRFLDEQPARP